MREDNLLSLRIPMSIFFRDTLTHTPRNNVDPLSGHLLAQSHKISHHSDELIWKVRGRRQRWLPGFRFGCFQSKLIMVEQSLMTRKFRQRRRFGKRGSPIFRYAEFEILLWDKQGKISIWSSVSSQSWRFDLGDLHLWVAIKIMKVDVLA